MERHTAIENQAESRSRQEQSLSLDEAAGLPIRDSVDPSGLPHAYASAPNTAHWPGLLEELDVRFLVLDIDHDAELFELFQTHSGWVIDSQDDQAVLLARTDIGPSTMRPRGER